MLQRGVQLWEIRGSFAHLLNYRCHKCKGKLAAVRTGARRTDGFTDTVEGAENPCTRGGVKMCVGHVCVHALWYPTVYEIKCPSELRCSVDPLPK